MNKNINLSTISSSFLLGVSCLVVMAAVMFVSPLIAKADTTITRQLEVGSRGTDVSNLQTFLAQDATLYPQGLVTGYFGFLTKAAVSNFQSRNGISAVGRVGPVTLPILNAQMATDINSPTILNVSVNTNTNNATVYWNTNENARGVVYYDSNPLVTYERTNSVDVSGNTAKTDTNYNTSQSVLISNLQSNTTYYYLIYSTDQFGNVSVTWPSTFRTN